jgi:hypothetical protein
MKPIGLCNQCEDRFATRRTSNSVRDFKSTKYRDVSCFGCGEIRVSPDGICISACRLGHATITPAIPKWRRIITRLTGI